jgi:hypothetical protein
MQPVGAVRCLLYERRELRFNTAGRDVRSTPRRVGGMVARSDFGITFMYQNVRQETKPRAIRSIAPRREK